MNFITNLLEENIIIQLSCNLQTQTVLFMNIFMRIKICLFLVIVKPGNIGGRCHSEREKLGPCFSVCYSIAINETVR